MGWKETLLQAEEIAEKRERDSLNELVKSLGLLNLRVYDTGEKRTEARELAEAKSPQGVEARLVLRMLT